MKIEFRCARRSRENEEELERKRREISRNGHRAAKRHYALPRSRKVKAPRTTEIEIGE